MKIIFATKNQNKVRELQEIMSGSRYEIISQKDAGIDTEVAETGITFDENALLKAREISKITLLPCLSDDSGLEVDFLSKEPGVMSARYMGENTSYDIKNKNIIERLSGVSFENRTARFVCSLAYCDVKNDIECCVCDTIEGYITDKMSGENGFGYDPIFYVREYNMTIAQMPSELKNSISHRGKAFRKMKQILDELCGI